MGNPKAKAVATKIPDILIDAVLDEIRRKMQILGYSQWHIPPSESEFSERIMGMTWKGTLTLTNGKLTGLDTLRRTRDSILSVSEHSNAATKRIVEVTFTVDLGATNLALATDYHLLMKKRERNGVATGNLSEVVLTMKLALNVLTRRMRITQLKFTRLGNVSTEITGLGRVLNYVASKVTKMMLNKSKWDLATRCEESTKDVLSELVDDTKWPGTQRDLSLLIGGLQAAFEENRANEAGPSKKRK